MKRVLLLLIVVAVALWSQEDKPDLKISTLAWSSAATTATIILPTQPPVALEIHNNGRMIMQISREDGSVTLGEGITPNEAAREFIQQLHAVWPQFCPQMEDPDSK